MALFWTQMTSEWTAGQIAKFGSSELQINVPGIYHEQLPKTKTRHIKKPLLQ